MTHHILIGLALCAPLTAAIVYRIATNEDMREGAIASVVALGGIAMMTAFLYGLFLIFSV